MWAFYIKNIKDYFMNTIDNDEVIENYIPVDTSGRITEFIDAGNNTSNSTFVPGNPFILTGDKIMLSGDDPGCGLFFVPVDDPSRATKVTNIVENKPSMIIGIVPKVDGACHLEVRTQFNSFSFNKKLRSIRGKFVLRVA